MTTPQRSQGRDGDREMTEMGYLLCPDLGRKLAIGQPIRAKGTIVGFEYSPHSPAAARGKRVFMQVLSRFVADSPARDMSLTAAPGAGTDHLREVGGPPENGGITIAEYLHDQPREWVTYFANIEDDHPRNNPTGIVRRREIDNTSEDLSASPDLVDEGFHRPLRWEDSEYLPRYWLGHDDIDHVEISQSEALTFILRILFKNLPLVEAL